MSCMKGNNNKRNVNKDNWREVELSSEVQVKLEVKN